MSNDTEFKYIKHSSQKANIIKIDFITPLQLMDHPERM